MSGRLDDGGTGLGEDYPQALLLGGSRPKPLCDLSGAPGRTEVVPLSVIAAK